MSSIYHLVNRGFSAEEERKDLRRKDMKIIAIVGEKEAPIAVPLVCRNILLLNSKKLLVILVWRKWVIKLGSKIRSG